MSCAFSFCCRLSRLFADRFLVWPTGTKITMVDMLSRLLWRRKCDILSFLSPRASFQRLGFAFSLSLVISPLSCTVVSTILTASFRTALAPLYPASKRSSTRFAIRSVIFRFQKDITFSFVVRLDIYLIRNRVRVRCGPPVDPLCFSKCKRYRTPALIISPCFAISFHV